MVSDFLDDPRVVERLRRGPAGAYVDDFAAWLTAAGYKRSVARGLIRGLERFAHWARQKSLDLGKLDSDTVARYHRYLSTIGRRKYRCGKQTEDVTASRRFLSFLREQGDVPACQRRSNCSDSTWPEQFREWMLKHRGVGMATLAAYTRVVEALISALGETPEAYRANDIRTFVLEQTQQHGIAKASQVVTATRMFLRFLAATKKAPNLVSSVPRIASWKLSSLPPVLAAADIDKMIAACDDRTDTALRDRAIILLGSRLGLRAGDIAALTFGDFDWGEACLKVSGKSLREDWLPIPQDVGEAILDYLERERTSVPEQHVFVKAVAPHGAMSSALVSSVVRRAMERAGIEDAPSRGVHVLRHSAATGMLRAGATLHQIGSVLRHKSIETTYHYAKVDVDLLQMVVPPWPELSEVTPC